MYILWRTSLFFADCLGMVIFRVIVQPMHSESAAPYLIGSVGKSGGVPRRLSAEASFHF